MITKIRSNLICNLRRLPLNIATAGRVASSATSDVLWDFQERSQYLKTKNECDKSKNQLYSQHCAEAYNQWLGTPPRNRAWTTQKRRSGGEALATVFDFTCLAIELKASRT